MSDHATLFRALLRKDLASFIHKTFLTVSPAREYQLNWHIEAMAWHLEQCLKGNIKRLIITVPPRHLKSICASVAFPAWALGHDPSLRIIAASYAADPARKHALDCRAVLQAPWYRRVFPRTRLHPDKNTELEVMTTARGFRYATSIGGSVTGRGGDLVLIDDPMKPEEAMSELKRNAVNQWYDGTLYPRLDNKAEGVIILIMQRLHVDDLIGHVIEQEPWTQINLPAIAEVPQRVQIGPDRFIERKPGELLHPERESHETLARTKERLGTYSFSAQYQQSPVPRGGAMIQWRWFGTYNELPAKDANDRIVQSWDIAAKTGASNDYSVGTSWLEHDGRYYLIEVLRERLIFPDLKRRVVTEAERHAADAVLIEDTGSGSPLIQELQREGPIRPIAITPEGDKVTRMLAPSAKIEAGYVLLPERAPWLQDFQTEILQFPAGKHDDQIDSLSQFLNWITKPRHYGPQIRWL
jgi:predicted phage terminase large subunit-like protein